MKIKQKITAFTFGLASILGFLAVPAAPAYAAECGGAETSIISCNQTNTGNNIRNNGVWAILILVLNIMTAGVGIAAVGGLIYAAVLYASARDNAGQVSKAKELMLNVVLGIVAYAAMFAFLQWIIPGGVFG